MKVRISIYTLALAAALVLPATRIVCQTASAQTASAQTATVKTATPLAATAPTAVPALVPFSGTAAADGKPPTGEASITFLIYKDESGGEPLFTESQTVALDAAGHYKAQLGATLPNGIPMDVFATGEARWLEVQIAGETPQARILLASVPYALKAGDASTLGGLPASAYALAGSRRAAATTPGLAPVTGVTTTGGTSGYVPEFTGAATIADSPLFVSGANVGVGTAAPTATLDVAGSGLFTGGLTVDGVSTLNGFLLLPALGTATTTTSYNSQYFKLVTSAYNSSTKTIVAPRFQLQAEVKGNNTANPIGTLNLIASNGPGSPVETGFSIQSNGIVNFAPGQTFPGGTGSGTITGVTAGTALTGGGTSGNVTLNLDTTKVPLLNAANTFNSSQTILGGAVVDGELIAGSADLGATSTGALTSRGNIVASGQLQASSSIVAAPLPLATATNTGGSSSFVSETSLYNSSTKAVTTPSFAWGAIPVNNDTASPSSELVLSYNPGGNDSFDVTGLTIDSKGLFTFAPGQTFPGTGTGNGTITGVAVASPLTGGGNGGSVALGLNTAALETTLNGTYAQLNQPNTFNSSLIANGLIEAKGGMSVPLGVGTTTPAYDLEVFGYAAFAAELAMVSNGTDAAISVNNINTGNGGREYWIDSGSKGAGVGEGNFAIYDKTANATRLVVNAGGQVGIPTTSAFGQLVVHANASGIGGAILAEGVYLPSYAFATSGVSGDGGDTDLSSGAEGGIGGDFSGGDADTAADAGVGLYVDGGYGSSDNQEGLSAEFTSDIDVNGVTEATVSRSRIDHPLDPANKYLVHASVQSSEMMNIYSGNVTTDELGLATVNLPEWFEAENADFRYQLTVIGRFAQAIVKDKVANQKFTIMTNASNVEVSWQITAVRQDAYAKAHPMTAVQEKPARERGFYQHPELYGQPREKQTEWGRRPQAMQRMQAQKEARKQESANSAKAVSLHAETATAP